MGIGVYKPLKWFIGSDQAEELYADFCDFEKSKGLVPLSYEKWERLMLARIAEHETGRKANWPLWA